MAILFIGLRCFFREGIDFLFLLANDIQKTLLDFILFEKEFLLNSSQPPLELDLSKSEVFGLEEFGLEDLRHSPQFDLHVQDEQLSSFLIILIGAFANLQSRESKEGIIALPAK